ncbi:hypothetical protein J2T12_002024 [Paenibacillus anaericanus]|nr:hypothetical protein [Paenibacillus anaericanus]
MFDGFISDENIDWHPDMGYDALRSTVGKEDTYDQKTILRFRLFDRMADKH